MRRCRHITDSIPVVLSNMIILVAQSGFGLRVVNRDLPTRVPRRLRPKVLMREVAAGPSEKYRWMAVYRSSSQKFRERSLRSPAGTLERGTRPIYCMRVRDGGSVHLLCPASPSPYSLILSKLAAFPELMRSRSIARIAASIPLHTGPLRLSRPCE